MNHPWLLEAALRSLLMGATIFVVLKAFRIRQVRAERTAWVLALLAAVAMPALMHWPIGPQLLKSKALAILSTPLPHRAVGSASLIDAPPAVVGHPRWTKASSSAPYAASSLLRPVSIRPAAGTARARLESRLGTSLRNAVSASMSYALAVYGCVAFLLLARLAMGVTLTLRLRSQAIPAPWYYGAARTGDDIRISGHIHTPATIVSSIVLPVSSAAWSAAKLRMVLAHERAHVQQSDFYVHLLAGVHCAIFWFSPFSWWLQRRLSALGEAMSDLAALQQAESRSSYAEVLLEFATAARQPMAAVSMARSSNLRPRIERLLNDQLFRAAFSTKRRHPFLAAGIVPVALLASASLVRVHAAVQAPSRPQPPVIVAPLPEIPVPEAQAPAVPHSVPSVVAAPVAPGQTEFAAIAASASDAARASAPAPSPVAPNIRQLAVDAAIDLRVKNALDAAHLEMLRIRTDVATQIATESHSHTYNHGDSNEDSFALVSGNDSSRYSFNGNWDKMGRIDVIRGETKGDFIYYEHDGKSYVIQDPALLAKAKAAYGPMEALGKQQEALGREQEALGKQQEALGRQQESVKVPTPDYKKELAELHEALQMAEKLDSSKEASQEQLGELQGKLAEIQGRLGALQGEAGALQGKLGDQQGALGEEQGKLGEKQGRIGEEQGKIAEEAQRTMKPLLEKAIQDGRAKPVE